MEKQSVFQINKQVIQLARKLEENKCENELHYSTLAHKINCLFLEYKTPAQLKTVVEIIYNGKLLDSLVNFISNTEFFP